MRFVSLVNPALNNIHTNKPQYENQSFVQGHFDMWPGIKTKSANIKLIHSKSLEIHF